VGGRGKTKRIAASLPQKEGLFFHFRDVWEFKKEKNKISRSGLAEGRARMVEGGGRDGRGGGGEGETITLIPLYASIVARFSERAFSFSLASARSPRDLSAFAARNRNISVRYYDA